MESNNITWQSDKLYDRDDQVKQISEAYERSCVEPRGAREIVTIAGVSGVGKTALASRLKDRVTEDGGYFVSGKFDQLAANTQATAQSYGPFLSALKELCRLVVGASVDHMATVKAHLESQLHAAELSLLKDTLPSLYGEQVQSKITADLSERITSRGVDAERSFVNTVTKLVHVFCSGQQPPLVLLLDDIQWADSKSLALLKAISVADRASDSGSKLMVICTFRNDEVLEGGGLQNFINEVQEAGVTVTNIELPCMSTQVVREMVADILRIPPAESKQIADAIFLKTDGNVFFVVQLLCCIHEDHLMAKNDSSQWHWDNLRILQFIENQTLVELLIRKIRRLPESTVEVLKIASCLGVAFSETILCSVGTVTEADVTQALKQSETSGLLVADRDIGSARFVHDKIQETAYSLIPIETVAMFHLNIGRRLAKGLPSHVLDLHLLLVAGQISRGIHLLHDANERIGYAEFYLRAGIKAALLSDYTTSATFLNIGIDLLGTRRWRDNYSLSLNLYNTAAEIEYYNGNLQIVDGLAAEVFLRARKFQDSLRAHFTHIYSLGSRNEMHKGLEEAFAVLRELGENFPTTARFYHIQGALMKCRRMLRSHRDDDILNLPVMRDKTKLAAMRLLLVVSTNAFYVKKEFLPLFCARIITLTLEHGISNMCCVGFSSLSLLFATRGEVSLAYRSCTLALRTFDKYEAKEWQARVAVTVYGGVYSLKHPFRDSVQPLLDAHQSGLVLGDSYSSFLCALVYSRIALFSGVSLALLAKEACAYRDLCRQRSLHVLSPPFDANLQLLLALAGSSPESRGFTDASPSEDENLLELKHGNPVNYLTFLFFKTFFAAYMNDLPRCQALLAKFRQEDLSKMLPFTLCFYFFLEGIITARLSGSSLQEQRHAHRCLRKLQAFASHCPDNFGNKVLLVQGELAASAGRTEVAVRKFQQSIALAKQQHLIHEQGIAYERAAVALKQSGRVEEASHFFHEAITCYNSWGAQAKVDQLRDLMLA